MKVELYIEFSSTSPREMERQYAYALRSGEYRKDKFGQVSGSYNKATLDVINEAVERINASCELTIYCSNGFIGQMTEKQLRTWRTNGFTKKNGSEVANKKEWMRLSKLLTRHISRVELGLHEYSEWMHYEMNRRK